MQKYYKSTNIEQKKVMQKLTATPFFYEILKFCSYASVLILHETRKVEVGFFGSLVITVIDLLWRPRFPRESKVTLIGTVSPGATTFLDGATAVHPHEERTLRMCKSDFPLFVKLNV